ncbi:MAG: glycosyltransferase [Muribaculaceae bacterium]|nr:glycosyltransferase [Muribaculaceae bacterium]
MKKRSIIFCINYMHTGGVEKSLLSLIDALPRETFDIHIALMQHKGELLGNIPGDVTVHTLRSIERNKPRLGFPLRHATDLSGPLSYLGAKLRGTLIPYYHHILGDERDIDRHFDIAVSYQGPSQLLDWYVPTHISADKYVAWIHFDIAHSFINPRTGRLVYPRYDRIFVVSESARQSFCRVFPEFAGRTEVFCNVVNPQCVRALASEYAVEDPAGKTMICTVARVNKAKGPYAAIDTAAELQRRGYAFCWYWVGGDELLEPCRREAERRGIADCLKFVGLKENPYPYMAACDVYVQPSLHEGFCITLAEARSFGMPVVCTPFSGSEQVAEQPNAQIVEGKPEALADAIMRAADMQRSHGFDPTTATDIHKLLEL